MKARSIFTGAAALLTTLTTLGLAAGASAQSVTEVRAASAHDMIAVVVSVGDLNLASPSGQEVLYYRLSAAAEKVCGSSKFRRAGGRAQASRNAECQQAAISRALAKVSQGAGAAFH